VLGITYHANTCYRIIVPPLDPANLRLTPGGVNREPQDVAHWNLGTTISSLEVVIQPEKLVRRWAAISALALADQA
jgi:hypothetical protein